jgi:hypothetical protein
MQKKIQYTVGQAIARYFHGAHLFECICRKQQGVGRACVT